jgi:DNA-binding transcriptional ArsR family regulator
VVSDNAWIAEGMVQKVVGLHDALAHSTRLRIVWALSREREVTPNEFAEMLGESQQHVSKHLKTLAHAGIVVGRKDGSCTLYSLRDREAMGIVDAAVAFVERQLREMRLAERERNRLVEQVADKTDDLMQSEAALALAREEVESAEDGYAHLRAAVISVARVESGNYDDFDDELGDALRRLTATVGRAVSRRS